MVLHLIVQGRIDHAGSGLSLTAGITVNTA